jgi:pentatricopeptide repeat protein
MEGTNSMLSKSSYETKFDESIKQYQKKQPLTSVFTAYNDMLSHGISPTPRIYAAMIRVLCERELEVEKTVGILQRQAARTGETIPNIDMLKAENNMDRAVGLFREAVELNKTNQLDLFLCNKLLLGLSHNSYVNDGLFVFEYMESHLSVDARSFSAIVTLFGSTGNLRAANEYFQKYMTVKDQLGGRRKVPMVHNALATAYVSVGDIQGALDVVQNRMVQDNIQITPYAYNKIIRGAFQAEKMDVVDDLFARFCTNDKSVPAPDENTFGIFLTNYSSLGEFDKAKKAYQSLKELNLATQYGHLANYVLACTGSNHMDEALDAVLTMTRAGLILEDATCRRFFLEASQNKQPEFTTKALRKMMEEYSKHRIINKKSFLCDLGFELVEVFKNDIISVAQILRTLRAYNVLPSPAISQSLLANYGDARADAEQWETLSRALNFQNFSILFESAFQRDSTPSQTCQTLLDILKDMEQLKVKPLQEWYLRISARMMKFDEFEDDWKEHFTLYFPAARTKIEKPTETTEKTTRGNSEEHIKASESELLSEEALNAVISGRFDKAISIIDNKIIQQEKVPTPEAIRDILLLSKKMDRLDVAESIYRIVSKPLIEKRIDNTPALSALYNSMLTIYAQNNHLKSAKEFYQNLSKNNLRPDGNALAALLLCLEKNEDEEFDPYDIYRHARSQKVILPTYFYNVLLSHLSNNLKLDQVLSTIDEMKQVNVVPNTITYASVISACLRVGSENHANDYFQKMISSPKYHPRIAVYNHMMQFYLQKKGDREKALEYYNLSKHHHVQPTSHTFRLLIEAYATLPEYDMWESRKLINTMRNEFGIKPTGIHYSMLIHSYGCLQNDIESAVEIYNDMRTKHILADGIASYRMLNAFFHNNMDERAHRLYERLSMNNKTTIHIENLFIEKYGAQGDLDAAQDIFYNLKDESGNDSDLVKNEETYRTMAKAYTHNNKHQEAANILEIMRLKGVSSEPIDTLKQNIAKTT